MAPRQPPAKKALFGGLDDSCERLLPPGAGIELCQPAAGSSQVTQVMSYRDGA